MLGSSESQALVFEGLKTNNIALVALQSAMQDLVVLLVQAAREDGSAMLDGHLHELQDAVVGLQKLM